MPDDLRECRLVPRVQCTSLWVMGSDVGLSVEVLDLMVDQVPDARPFEKDSRLCYQTSTGDAETTQGSDLRVSTAARAISTESTFGRIHWTVRRGEDNDSNIDAYGAV